MPVLLAAKATHLCMEPAARRPGPAKSVRDRSRVLTLLPRHSTNGSFKANISRGGDGEAFPLKAAMDCLPPADG